ncbi:RNA polymerase [Sugarcane striate mosaic-associated virus]|uniref:RNA polymerase n=1 Tax=Sugarcane striate mosaic-associated virus TaxID=167927 RepID=Q91BP7_9VIRU|nr:RNA polymerase [Sugarcane striate mosaic-associated virus]AAL05444.1 RNA polymerase [Sugarcane striate mosaic-associated virus]
MAILTFKPPKQLLIAQLSSEEQARIRSSVTRKLAQEEENDQGLFSYHVSPYCAEKLIKSGVQLCAYSSDVHSHPCCKMLENHILYRVLPSYVDSDFILVGIKHSKLAFLKPRGAKKNVDLSTVKVLNRFVTSLDRSRYGKEFNHLNIMSTFTPEPKGSSSYTPELKSLIPNLERFKGHKLFFHDELHYWKDESIIKMLSSLEPSVVYATVVCPPELLIGAKQSYNDWLYTFEIIGDQILFAPDGKMNSAYFQPVNCARLLRAKRIWLDKHNYYDIDLVYSNFSHHLLCFSKGSNLKNQDLRAFSDFDAIKLNYISELMVNAESCFPISWTVVKGLYDYLESLTKEDYRSGKAKQTHYMPNCSGKQLKFCTDLIKLYLEAPHIKTMIGSSPVHNFKVLFTRMFPACIKKNFSFYKGKLLKSLFEHLAPLAFHVKTYDLHLGFVFKFQELKNVTDLMEDVHEFEVDFVREYDPFQMRSTPYVGLAPLRDESYYKRMKCGEAFFDNMIGQIMRSHLSGYGTNTNPAELFLRINLTIVGRVEFLVNGHHDFVIFYINKHFKVKKDPRYKNLYFANMTLELKLRWLSCRRFRKYQKFLPCGLVSLAEVQILWRNIARSIQSGSHEAQGQNEQVDSHGDGVAIEEPERKGNTLEKLNEATLVTHLQHYLKNPVVDDFSRCAFDVDSKTLSNLIDCLKQICDTSINVAIGCDCSNSDLNLLKISKMASSVASYVNLDNVKSVKINWTEAGEILVGLEDQPLFVVVLGKDINSITLARDHVMQFPELEENSAILIERNNISKISVSGPSALMIFPKDQNLLDCHLIGCDQIPPAKIDFIDGYIKTTVDPSLDSRLTCINVPANGDCFWHSVSLYLSVEAKMIKDAPVLRNRNPQNARLVEPMGDKVWAENEAILNCACFYNLNIRIVFEHELHTFRPHDLNEDSTEVWLKNLDHMHFCPAKFINSCVMEPISKAVDIPPLNVQRMISSQESLHSEYERLSSGKSFDLLGLESLMTFFNIGAEVQENGHKFILNENGSRARSFILENNHIEFVRGDKKDLRKEGIGFVKLMNANQSKSVLSLACSKVKYTPSYDRAFKLSKAFANGYTGIMLSSEKFGEIEINGKNDEREINVMMGTFGAGKTRVFVDYIQAYSGRGLFYVSPRKNLKELFDNSAIQAVQGFKTKSSDKKGSVKSFHSSFTFETAIMKAGQIGDDSILIIDEIQLYPPGYLDLILLLIPSSCMVICAGDPVQSDYDSDGDRLYFLNDKPDIERLLEGQSYKYAIKSRRFKSSLFIGRLPCDMPGLQGMGMDTYGIYESISSVPQDLIKRSFFLVSSFDEKKIIKANFKETHNKILTFGESTGSTFQEIVILITTSSEKASERRWVTALSRASTSISFLNLTGIGIQELISTTYFGRFLQKFLSAECKREDIKPYLYGEPKFVDDFRSIGRRSAEEKEVKVDGDPWLKCILHFFETPIPDEVECVKVDMVEQKAKTHLPVSSFEVLWAHFNEKLLLKEIRERRIDDLVSDQFAWDHRSQGLAINNAATRYESIFPRHHHNDKVTFLMAVKKRLTFGSPAKNGRMLREAMPYGEILLKEFLKRVPIKNDRNDHLFLECLMDFEEKKTSKDSATIANHCIRSQNSWPIDIADIFMKSQLCTKMESMFCEAKAGQTLACFHHVVLARFSPWVRYIEKKLVSSLPDNYYIHSGKNFDQLNAWVKANNFVGECTESDYEAFDASQDHYILAFELALMKYLGLPNELIEDYKYIKIHLGSKLGDFAIMRFTGEASTFLFNTMANMLFTFLVYDIKGNESICFAGDDMYANTSLKTCSKNKSLLKKFTLKAKVQVTESPTFCGWHLTEDGIYKDPILVSFRFMIALEKGILHECLESYSIECSYAYNMGSAVSRHMDQLSLAYHYCCVRFILKNSKLLRSDVKKFFKDGLQLTQ